MRARLDVRRAETLAFVTQTTLSVDDTQAIVEALRERFPGLQAPRIEDICYATQNRQDAVKQLLTECDVLVVVGSVTSSNSNRLRELADRAGIPGYLVDGPENLRREWFEGRRVVGVTAGASARSCWCSRWWSSCAAGAGRCRAHCSGVKRTSCSACPRRCGRPQRAASHQPQHNALVSRPSVAVALRRPVSSIVNRAQLLSPA